MSNATRPGLSTEAPIAGVHFKSELNIESAGVAAIRETLSDHDVQTVYTVGGTSFDKADSTFTTTVPGAGAALATMKHSLHELGVLKARVATPSWLESQGVVVVNGVTLRSLSRKDKQYDAVEAIEPGAMPYSLVVDPANFKEQLESMTGDRVVIKRVFGGNSSWVKVVSKQDAPQALAEMRAQIAKKREASPNFNDVVLLQEYRPDSTLPQEVFAEDAPTDVYRDELRAYGFIDSKGESAVDFAGRRFVKAGGGSGDALVPVNRDKLTATEVLTVRTLRLGEALLQRAGAEAGFVVVDYTPPQPGSGTWGVGEVNLKDPMMLSFAKAPEAALRQRRAFGKILAQVAWRHHNDGDRQKIGGGA